MRPARAVTRTAGLLYWLVVVAGLVGFSVLRALSPAIEWYAVADEVVPVWIGTLAGIATGQLLALARVRTWVLVVASVVLALGPVSWAAAVFFAIQGALDQAVTSTLLLTFVPAALSGYLALSERGALVAFWFPAVLWMVALLDGQSGEALDRSRAVPFVVGLGVLFVAFLKARETRRAAVWQSHATVRLGKVVSRTVLRASPLRVVAEHAGAGVVAVGALGLAALVAPRLWQIETSEHAAPASGLTRRLPNEIERSSAGWGPPRRGEITFEAMPRCCPSYETPHVQQRRVSEYIPLLSSMPKASAIDPSVWASCARCTAGTPVVPYYEEDERRRAQAAGYAWSDTPGGGGAVTGYGRTGSGGAYGGGGYGGATTYGGAEYGAGTPYVPSAPSYVAAGAAPVVTDAVRTKAETSQTLPEAKTKTSAKAKADAEAKPKADAEAKAKADAEAKTKAAAQAKVEAPAAPSPSAPPVMARQESDGASPWGFLVAVLGAAIALHFGTRAARRALVVRHLAEPFWAETVDQRISNHWERMLVGLRDAGITPRKGELPMAFAKRVGIQGMETCAEILERVRHGVGVEPLDLAAMKSASNGVYAKARASAGAAARTLAWLRWPLA